MKLKRLLLIFLVLIVIISLVACGNTPPKGKDGCFSLDVFLRIFNSCTFTAEDGTNLPYRIYIPFDYDSSKKYPVLTVLHGAGERGTDNVIQLRHMLEDMFNLESTPLIDAIVICPQCPPNNQWVDTPWENGNYSTDTVKESNEIKAVLELIESVENKYSVDSSRLYLMGVSMGGYGVWDIMSRHTEKFAAMIAICGGADTSMAERLKDKPIYAVHCKNDSIVPFSATFNMVNALLEKGSTSIFFDDPYADNTGYSDHSGAWEYTSRNPAIINWLFSQSLILE